MWRIEYCLADRHWLIIAPVGCIYRRYAYKWQASEALEGIMRELARDKAKRRAK